MVVRESDLEELVGAPPGGTTPYREAVRAAMEDTQPDPAHAVAAAGLVGAAAVAAVGIVAVVWARARRR